MIPKITILIKNDTVVVTENINFNPIELPYGCIGYRVNGSSQSSESDLNHYWSFVDSVFQRANIPTSDYVTLYNIVTSDIFYGIQP